MTCLCRFHNFNNQLQRKNYLVSVDESNLFQAAANSAADASRDADKDTEIEDGGTHGGEAEEEISLGELLTPPDGVHAWDFYKNYDPAIWKHKVFRNLKSSYRSVIYSISTDTIENESNNSGKMIRIRIRGKAFYLKYGTDVISFVSFILFHLSLF